MKKENSMKALSILLVAIISLSMVTMLTTTTRAVTDAQIETAITDGVAYLAGQQNPDGSWGAYAPPYASVNTSYTGLVLIKLQMRAYELGYASPFDPSYPYSGNVTAGWSFIFSTDMAGNPLYALKQTLSLQDHTGGASGTVDNPDNGNGYGIYFDNPYASYQVYTTGIVLMALHASGTPNRPNDGAIDYDGDGSTDTFLEIAQDAADWLAWAQSDLGPGEGGWSYWGVDNGGNAYEDNSNSGYAMLGLAAAEALGCTVPAWVRTELNVWITSIQDTSGGTDDGGSWYRPPGPYGWSWVNELKTGNLIFEMTFYGDTPGVTRFDDAMDYITRHWQDMNNDPGWGFGISPSNYQAMFCLMKGFEYSGINLIDLDGDNVPEHDWYAEFATVLVNQQNGDGSWYHGGYGSAVIDTAWALLTLEKAAPPPRRTLDKTVIKKVKVIPAPVQFWREFIGGVTDIIVFDPPEITEGVALVRDYAVLHDEGSIPLEFLTWSGTEGLPWEPIDTPEDPYILPVDGIVEYDIPTDEAATAVLVRYTVAWESTPDVIECHFVNEAILESKSPQVIVGQLSNFDVHNDYHEPVDNFELELYGIQPSDIVDWFPGWGTPPQINPIPPSAEIPEGGTEIMWMDSTQPVEPCQWVHFGLHLKPGVIAAGVKAYWTQRPSAELGDVIHNEIEVTVPGGETATVVDTLPSMVKYITGTFTVDGVPATPTITTSSPPPPIITEISYTITESGDHVIKFDVKVVEAKSWEDTEVCNVATATWFDEAGDVIDTKEDVECFIIHPFEELHKNVGIPKADVVFAIDLTGSMANEIAQVKANATYIMNSLAAQIADVQFGLISFMDYNGTYSTTAPGSVPLTYTAQYGSAASGDYPYNLDQDMTNNIATMTAKINGLTLGWGADGPQDYTRIIHEAYSDSNLHWRTGAKRILILFGDNVPHDTNFDNNNDGTPDNTGGDPGRDTILGTADDLDFETEVANAAANGVHIMAVYSGWAGTKFPWTYMASQTGGGYFELEEAEQIPDAIKDLIKSQALETLTIEAKTETQWAVVIDVVNTFSYTMTDTVITDRFGAELEIDWYSATQWYVSITHGTASYATKGGSAKVFLTWEIGDLLPGETARLILLVSTDINPGGHQEYSEPGIYELNSGATLKFIDPEQDMQLSAYTDSIYVIVIPPEGDMHALESFLRSYRMHIIAHG